MDRSTENQAERLEKVSDLAMELHGRIKEELELDSFLVFFDVNGNVVHLSDCSDEYLISDAFDVVSEDICQKMSEVRRCI